MTDVCNVSSEHKNDSEQSESGDQLTIYDLDEDSLLEIFRYLGFNELLDASGVCDLFRQLSRRCLRKIRHFELDYRALMNDFHLPRINVILGNIGPHLEAFKFSGGFIMNEDLKRTIVNDVALNCVSLQHLTINYVELRVEHLNALKVLLAQLTGLDMGRCALQDDSFGTFIANASQLKALAIPGNAELNGNFLDAWQNCQQLEQLDVSYCYSFSVGKVEAFLTRATNLKGVDVTACTWLRKDKRVFLDCERDIELGVKLPVFSYFKAA